MNSQEVLVIASHGFPENETVVNHSIVQGQVVVDTVKNRNRDKHKVSSSLRESVAYTT